MVLRLLKLPFSPPHPRGLTVRSRLARDGYLAIDTAQAQRIIHWGKR